MFGKLIILLLKVIFWGEFSTDFKFLKVFLKLSCYHDNYFQFFIFRKHQRRLDSRPQSNMDVERLIPRVASLTVDCRGVNISLTKKIWKLSNDKSSVGYSVKTAYLLYCCDLHYDLCFTIASSPFFKLHGMCCHFSLVYK